ncbi:ankyrin repeat-containing domain protein [Diplogelasinospora grovesii]|uniref:Ankyrin repeat-containing domain protein n=1 Tax=Diplogelasinospora grovesii TaxID=303347 RepID=A0AAN6NAE3_9PEZI|nr:ankyrin repeat-containing domain protein [Diplogelasinospora grovesii]
MLTRYLDELTTYADTLYQETIVDITPRPESPMSDDGHPAAAGETESIDQADEQADSNLQQQDSAPGTGVNTVHGSSWEDNITARSVDSIRATTSQNPDMQTVHATGPATCDYAEQILADQYDAALGSTQPEASETAAVTAEFAQSDAIVFDILEAKLNRSLLTTDEQRALDDQLRNCCDFSQPGSISTLRKLLREGADPDACLVTPVDSYYSLQSWPLQEAALWGNTEAMGILLSAGANPNPGDYRTKSWLPSPLVLSIYRDNEDAANLLLAAKVSVHLAAGRYGVQFSLQGLRERCQQISLPMSGRECEVEYIPLHACLSPLSVGKTMVDWTVRKRLINRLLDSGANVNEIDGGISSRKRTLLAQAIDLKDEIADPDFKFELCRNLIKRGADVNLGNGSECSAMKIALRKGDVNIVKLLLSKGAKPSAGEELGASCRCTARLPLLLVTLGLVLKQTLPGWSAYYLDAGFDINEKIAFSYDSKSLSHRFRGQPTHVSCLTVAKTIETIDGLSWATAITREDMIKVLRDAGAK